MPAYDAFLLVSFGGPEGPADVMPFLQNVTRGRGVPPERLASVAEHYYAASRSRHCWLIGLTPPTA
jgi:ferrochelatase